MGGAKEAQAGPEKGRRGPPKRIGCLGTGIVISKKTGRSARWEEGGPVKVEWVK